MVIQTWIFKRHFLKNEVSPSLQGKKWTVIDKIQTFKLQSEF